MERNLYHIEASCAVYNPYTKELFTVGTDSVKKFDVQNTQLLNESTVAKGVKHVFSVDCLGDSLAIKNMSGSIYVYSLINGHVRLKVRKCDYGENTVYLVQNGEKLLSIGMYGELFIMDIETQERQVLRQTNKEAVRCTLSRLSDSTFLWIEWITHDDKSPWAQLYLVAPEESTFTVFFLGNIENIDSMTLFYPAESGKLFYANGFDVYYYDMVNRNTTCLLSKRQYEDFVYKNLKIKKIKINPYIEAIIQNELKELELEGLDITRLRSKVMPFSSFAVIDSEYLVFTITDVIAVYALGQKKIVFQFKKKDAYFNCITELKEQNLFFFGGWEYSVLFSKRELCGLVE